MVASVLHGASMLAPAYSGSFSLNSAVFDYAISGGLSLKIGRL